MCEVIRRALDRPEAIIAALVDAVVAGRTKHDAVIDVVCAAPFDVPDVVRLYRLPELVLSLSGYTQGANRGPTGGAKFPLSQPCLFLSLTAEFLLTFPHGVWSCPQLNRPARKFACRI